ncbi:MAG: 3-isopropylmalate dehydrogenase [Chloroflexi bacterium]|nr:3-isopropylmalate dehydrogenase [Chloroflexota bacterium]
MKANKAMGCYRLGGCEVGGDQAVKFNIGVIPGDGIGREIVPAAVTVLEEVGRHYKHNFNLRYGLIAGAAMDKGLPPLPPETLDMCRKSDAVLFGAAGDPKYDFLGAKVLPNSGLYQLRRELELSTDLRPAKYLATIAHRTSFRPEILKGVDLVILRHFACTLSRGRKKTWQNSRGRQAQDRLVCSEREIRSTLGFAFRFAQSRRRKLMLVCQYSNLATSHLWREIAGEIAPEYPDVELGVMAPDNCAMQLIRNPAGFDVIVGDNRSTMGMLNNQAAMLMGSLGMAPSATLNPGKVRGVSKGGSLLWGFGFYEPIHGSAPSHAGKNEANPIATIMSLALLLRHSLALDREAKAIERAVDTVLKTYRTYDLMEPGKTKVGTREMGELVAAAL